MLLLVFYRYYSLSDLSLSVGIVHTRVVGVCVGAHYVVLRYYKLCVFKVL